MESSSSSPDQREEEERHPLLHSPCHFFEQLITACPKCLGLDHDSSSSAARKTNADHQEQYPPPQTEVEMKFREEVVVQATGTSARLRIALTVKRPPIGSGKGPQINKASS